MDLVRGRLLAFNSTRLRSAGFMASRPLGIGADVVVLTVVLAAGAALR